jgi:hypothetical protein
MKLLTPFTSVTALTATYVFVENVSARPLRGRQVVERVRVTGSDAGSCDYFYPTLPPGCDANYNLLVDKFADGKVEGVLQDSFGDGTGIHAKIDYLNISNATNGGKIADASGNVSKGVPSFPAGSRVCTAAKILSNGTGYYTVVSPVCADYNAVDILWFEHVTGVVKIEKSN